MLTISAKDNKGFAIVCFAALAVPVRRSVLRYVLTYPEPLTKPNQHLFKRRFESSSAILASMAEAVDVLVTSGNDTGQVACRVMYRLAHHADMLYAGIQAQKQSPEWNTAQAVIKQKRQQVSTLLGMLSLPAPTFVTAALTHFACFNELKDTIQKIEAGTKSLT